jgi:membrane protease YdiL (CAAX protease family)
MKGLADRRVERKAQPTKPAKNLGHPLTVITFTLFIFLVSQLVAAVVAEIAIGVTHPRTSVSLDDSAFGQFAYILMAEGIAAYLVVWLVRRRGLSLSTIGLGRRPSANDFIKGLGGFVVFFVVLMAINIVVGILWPDLSSEKQNVGFNNIHTSADNIFALVSLVILPPLGEEILMRGYLYSGLRMVWRFWPALIMTSLLFGLAHLEFGSGGPLVWAAAVDTFTLSIVLVFLREKTGALYAGMMVHMLNNVIAFGVHFHP